MGVGIEAIGVELPKNKLSTLEIAKKTNMSMKVYDKLGCKEIWKAGEGEDPTTLAVKATKKALAEADVAPEDVGLIVANCWNSEYHMWQFSAKIQEEIDAVNATSLDIYGGCNAVAIMVQVAFDQMRANKSIKYALIVCTEQLGGGSFPQFIGDGACTILLKNDSNRLVIKEFVQLTDKLPVLGLLEKGGTKDPFTPDLKFGGSIWDNIEFNMDKYKKEIKPFVYDMTAEAILLACKKYGCSIDELSKIFMVHQQKYFSDDLMKKLGVAEDTTPSHYIEKSGHFGGHDIFMSLYWALRDKLIKKGDKLGFVVFGQMEFYGFIVEY